MSATIFWQFIKIKLKGTMEYRGAFMLGIWGQIIGYAANYLVIWLLLQRFQSLAGWSWPEVAFMYSINLFTYAIGASLTFAAMTGLSGLVITGNFDKYLVKPLHPLLYLSADLFAPGYIAHILISGFMLLWSMGQLSIAWTLDKIFFLMVSLISGSLLQAAAFIFFGSLVFVLSKTQFLFQLFFSVKDFISYPLGLYGVAIQLLFTFVIPLAFINYYPAMYLLSKQDQLFPHWIGWLSPLVCCFFFWISYRLWMRGANKYQSAGG